MKRAIAMVTKVASNDDGDGDGGKSNGDGDEGDGRATMRAMAAAMTVVGNDEGDCNNDEGGEQQRGQGQQGDGDGDKGGGRATAMVTKRAVAMATRVAVVGRLYSVQYKSIFGAPDKVRGDKCEEASPLRLDFQKDKVVFDIKTHHVIASTEDCWS